MNPAPAPIETAPLTSFLSPRSSIAKYVGPKGGIDIIKPVTNPAAKLKIKKYVFYFTELKLPIEA